MTNRVVECLSCICHARQRQGFTQQGFTQHAEQALAHESAGAASAHLDKRLGNHVLVRTRLTLAVAVQLGGGSRS